MSLPKHVPEDLAKAYWSTKRMLACANTLRGTAKMTITMRSLPARLANSGNEGWFGLQHLAQFIERTKPLLRQLELEHTLANNRISNGCVSDASFHLAAFRVSETIFELVWFNADWKGKSERVLREKEVKENWLEACRRLYDEDRLPEVPNELFVGLFREAVETAALRLSQDGRLNAKEPDGPIGVDAFRWDGTIFRGVKPRANKLLTAVWLCKEHTCSLDDALDAVCGASDGAPDSGIDGARKDANEFFRKKGIPLLVKSSRRLAKVCIVQLPPTPNKQNGQK